MKWRSGIMLLGLLLAGALAVSAQTTAICSVAELDFVDYESVIEACSADIDEGEAGSYAHFVRAYAHAELGNLEEAVRDYTKALFYYSRDVAAYNNRGLAHEGLGNFEAALADYTSALSINDAYQYALSNRMLLLLELGREEEAEADANYLLDTHGDSATGYLIRGDFYRETGDMDAAIADYDRAVQLEPNSPDIVLGRGFALWSVGDYAGAAPDYHRFPELLDAAFEVVELPAENEPFTIVMPGNTTFRIPITLSAGDRLTVRAEGQSPAVDPTIIILDPDNTPIFADDDGGVGQFGLDAVIDGFPVPEDGDYIIEIGFAGGGSTGEVIVTVRTR